MTDIGAYLAEIAVQQPAMLRLGMAASLAARIEPELLRQLRMKLVPEAMAEVEADLWFSPLVERAGPSGIVLSAAATAALHARLGDDLPLLRAAAAVIRDAHQNEPDLVQLEERLGLWALEQRDDVIETELDAVFATMSLRGRGLGVSRWALRALGRLPAEVREKPTAFAIAAEAMRQIASDPATPIQTAAKPPSPATTIWLRFSSRTCEIATRPLLGGRALRIATRLPTVARATWDETDRQRSDILSLDTNGLCRVAFTGDRMQLQLADGTAWQARVDRRTEAPQVWIGPRPFRVPLEESPVKETLELVAALVDDLGWRSISPSDSIEAPPLDIEIAPMLRADVAIFVVDEFVESAAPYLLDLINRLEVPVAFVTESRFPLEFLADDQRMNGRQIFQIWRDRWAADRVAFGEQLLDIVRPTMSGEQLRLSFPIRVGDKGQVVLDVQEHLNRHRFEVPRDGIFGPTTAKAVQEFQRTRMPPDLVRGWGSQSPTVGPLTWVALQSTDPAPPPRNRDASKSPSGSGAKKKARSSPKTKKKAPAKKKARKKK